MSTNDETSLGNIGITKEPVGSVGPITKPSR